MQLTTRPGLLCAFALFFSFQAFSQHSVARRWNEQLLHAISTDLARPTVHARNLFHVSVAMYDAWAVYTDNADTYLLGKTVHGFHCTYHPVPTPADVRAEQEKAISYAVYRIMRHRFAESPAAQTIFKEMNALMDSLGYSRAITSTNYKCGGAEMGNYIATCILDYGLQDGSNEANGYANQYYEPVNPPMRMTLPGNPTILDLNRWQPLEFTQFVDQSGNPFGNIVTPFLSPEWGNVAPFSLQPEDATLYERDGHTYTIYHDPGPPPFLDTSAVGGMSEEYKWGHALVAIWSSLLDPADSVLLDISPASMGNNSGYPASIPELRDFYNLYYGGDDSPGRPLNPKTNQPYTPQIVHRGDFTRVIAEFWADGPSSETPPGHWFTILNYVNDQPGLVKRIRGTGPLCDDLEWDVKAYFALGGAMHDVAIAAWGIKGWYDSARPVSAIRGMAELGQSSDPGLPNFHPGGLPLIPGYIELIQAGDSLAGANSQYIGELKLKAWKGPDYVSDPKTDEAGVGWIRAANWWPYQRPTFVTPPFAGYISGHSTYSRAAAELLTELTGDPYFPGGLGEFYCPKNEYLVFEEGPSTDITLQWATYRDASDQCSLSRIYGGIHPPVDDIPGRLIGIKIGLEALDFAEQYFTKTTPPYAVSRFKLFPNPTTCVVQIEYEFEGNMPVQVLHSDGRLALSTTLNFINDQAILNLDALGAGVYIVTGQDNNGERLFQEKVIRL
ncbi:MAG: T9SS type A sorting domain-containing protein [Bacteroidetes bacterium]|nr:MAG: T9SS type A sorting domain-containing protein [Bacteroidota bacterium]